MAADWLKIKSEYITTEISYRDLAQKHDVSFSTLQVRAKNEKWKDERIRHRDNVGAKLRQKTVDVIVQKEARIIDRKYALSEKLLDKMEKAIEELDLLMVTNKKRIRTIEYNDNTAVGKPTKETIDDTETILQMASIIDRAGLKQLASALKDIKDIQMDMPRPDEGSEQEKALTTEELKLLAKNNPL